MNKPTIPSTLDQIADGSTRKLSNYIPIAGCTLGEDVPIIFTGPWGDSRNKIYSGAIEIENDADQFYVGINAGGPDITFTSGGESTTYGNKSISLYDETNFYQQLLQEKSGTLALTSDIPAAVTESTVSGWGFTKNTGTLTTETDPVFSASAAAGITSSNITTWNGKQDAISDLATIRSNASAGAAKVSANNSTITIQKNGTTVDSFTTNASSAKTINMTVNELPTVSASDNGKILQVVNGAWSLVSPVSIYTGSGTPSNSVGNNGDIYIQS